MNDFNAYATLGSVGSISWSFCILVLGKAASMVVWKHKLHTIDAKRVRILQQCFYDRITVHRVHLQGYQMSSVHSQSSGCSKNLGQS